MTDKCAAAVAMGKRRWANTTAKERQEFASKLRKARAKKTTKAQRSEIARKAALARHGKK